MEKVCLCTKQRFSSDIERSGTNWYKADAKHACCPHYSTRYAPKEASQSLDNFDFPRVAVSEYKPHKDQRKAVNQFTRYILGPEYVRKAAGLCPKTREYVSHLL